MIILRIPPTQVVFLMHIMGKLGWSHRPFASVGGAYEELTLETLPIEPVMHIYLVSFSKSRGDWLFLTDDINALFFYMDPF